MELFSEKEKQEILEYLDFECENADLEDEEYFVKKRQWLKDRGLLETEEN